MKVLTLFMLAATALSLRAEDGTALVCARGGAEERPEDKAKAYRLLFEKVGRPGLPDLMKGKDTGLALQASWEFHKKLVKRPKKPDRGPDDTYAPAEMKKFVEFLKDRTKSPVPEWWQLAITDLSVNKGGGHMYFGFNQEPKPLEEMAHVFHGMLVWGNGRSAVRMR